MIKTVLYLTFHAMMTPLVFTINLLIGFCNNLFHWICDPMFEAIAAHKKRKSEAGTKPPMI